MKPSNKKIVTDEQIALFNAMRDNKKTKEFNRKEILDLLKQLGYSRHQAVLKAMCEGENPPIIRVKMGRYVFNPKPVYKERLQLVMDNYTKIANPKNYKDGKYCSMSEEQCIAFLKEKGYKVYRQIVRYEEV